MLSNVTIKDVTGAVSLSGYMTNLTVAGSGNQLSANLSGFIKNSTINSASIGFSANPYFSPLNSYLTGSTLNATAGYSQSSGWSYLNTINALYFNISGGLSMNTVNAPSSFQQNGGMIIFSALNGPYDCNSYSGGLPAQIYGNEISGTPSYGTCLNSNNSTSSISSGSFVYIDDGSQPGQEQAITQVYQAGTPVTLTANVFTSSGIVSNPSVSWQLTHTYNGSTIVDGTYTGQSITLKNLAGGLDYQATITAITGYPNPMGTLSRTIQVAGPTH